ncbi:hypothetical protein ACFFJI_10000 [Allobacillus sp. GCM10007491]|uniref:Uncharacterized protein n=1 Tax=Allobacillus saliphilus TaxID=2912308 RepID=A0A941CU16_9BACI|nr:hypothetical protein [Allobacillus saliphilus]MBR7552556.1 hypothetical protein [Allobacillus saliphilus]
METKILKGLFIILVLVGLGLVGYGIVMSDVKDKALIITIGIFVVSVSYSGYSSIRQTEELKKNQERLSKIEQYIEKHRDSLDDLKDLLQQQELKNEIFLLKNELELLEKKLEFKMGNSIMNLIRIIGRKH